MKKNDKLEALLKSYQPEMTETLASWVKVPSVRGEAEEGAPFGRDVRNMLDRALKDLTDMGFGPRDIDGYCLDAEIGEGSETVAVLAHLDVVPVGDGWHDDPYGAVIRDGHMYGRGTSDDKGPAVAALYAMKAIRDAGIPLTKKVRLILGCDEECGMEDLRYYEAHVDMPEVGFSPDAEFPLINTEKGITAMTLNAGVDDNRLLSIASGERCNIVPGKASALVAGDVREAAVEAFDFDDEDCAIEVSLEDGNTCIMVTGVPAHASLPDNGKNAAKMLLHVLKEMGIGGAPVALLDETAGSENAGSGLGIAGADEVSGPLTINLGLLSCDHGKLSVTFDCRFPVMFNGKAIRATVAKRLAPAGFVMEEGRLTEPHHVPESSELVAGLMKVYNTIMETNARPFAIGGGTYAKHLKEGVAFGMLFPGEPATEHQADENICLDNIYKAARIYAYAILELCSNEK